jgi:uncharacterized protein (DUF2147 family)
MQVFRITLILLLTLASLVASAQLDSPVGRWKTLDEDTGEPKSVVQIYERNGKYYGKIAEILTGNTDARCEECEGNLKDKPILGMVIMRDLVPEKGEPSSWEGGRILDPQNGSDYRLSVWYEDNDPNTLYVRGKHWTGLYRTQEWVRE